MNVFPPADVHFTTLKAIELSPAHFRAKCLEEDTWTRPKSQGSLLHALTLGGDYAVWHKQRKGNAWEEFKAQHLAENPQRLIVTQTEYDEVARAADALMRDPFARERLEPREGRQREVALRWDVMGRSVAGRLDVVDSHAVTDLKSTRSAEPGWFRRHAIGMRYHAQLSWYLEGAKQNGFHAHQAFIVAVELKPPFAVTVFELTLKDIIEGEKFTRLWMERLLGCERSDHWPAYVQSVVELNVSETQGLLID